MPTIPWRSAIAPQADVDYLVMASRLRGSVRPTPATSGRFRVGEPPLTSPTPQVRATSCRFARGRRSANLHELARSARAWRVKPGAFVRTMPHLAVMGRLRPQMEPTRFLTWTIPGTLLPIRWEEDAIERLMRSTATTRKGKL